MTKSVADYQVLFDGGFTLDAASNDHEKNLTFILPTNFKIEDGIRKPILAFHAWAQQDSHFKVRMNQREILSWNLSASDVRGLWDPFNGSVPFPNNSSTPNNVPVVFVITQGKVQFGQIVIWYQVDVDG